LLDGKHVEEYRKGGKEIISRNELIDMRESNVVEFHGATEIA
jgi:hypothetical protein